MAAIAKSGKPRPCNASLSPENKLTLIMAAAGVAGDAVYIDSAGKFALCDGSANAAAADFYGLLTTDAPVGEAGTAAHSCRFQFSTGQTPGAKAFMSTSVAGGLDTVNATVTRPIGQFVDANRLEVGPPFHGMRVV